MIIDNHLLYGAWNYDAYLKSIEGSDYSKCTCRACKNEEATKVYLGFDMCDGCVTIVKEDKTVLKYIK